jgi:cytochrome c oxidase subunit IV
MKYKTETDPNSTKEKRSKRIFIAVAAVLFLLATTSYFVATKGFDYVRIL